MGIKGIFSEIGPGQRIALIKLAVEHLERTQRPLRIAVDVSIWQFQVQSGKGGSNPALRTLYYRLLRLLSMCIQPLFVFDGLQKPPFKRNKCTGFSGSSLTDFYTKQLLKLFGFPFCVAPGEAEAECALLQREGLVDAVLSEDVDTLMFGCGKTLRNWSSERSRGNHKPTHVAVYDANATKEGKSGLDREGMILVALMSGGDYITEGIPGCGIKVACEAARAGFGTSLCKLSRTDTIGLNLWRDNLVHELQTNEGKHFRIRHKALQVPDKFPNREVLGYYTHPVVSSPAKLAKLKEEVKWDGDVDVAGLRLFVAEAFDWTYKTGAKKFIRGLAPALLVSKMRVRANRRASGFDDLVYTTMSEMELVRNICGKRQHFSTDGITEMRLVYNPADIVGLDLDAEADEGEDHGRNGLAPAGNNETLQTDHSEDESNDSSERRSRSPRKRNATNYDPTEFQKFWVPESLAKVSIPLMAEDYDEALRNPPKVNKSKVASQSTARNGGMPKGALDCYITVNKPLTDVLNSQSPRKPWPVVQAVPSIYSAPFMGELSPLHKLCFSTDNQLPGLATKTISKGKAASIPETDRPKFKAGARKKGQISENPWSLAQLSSPTRQIAHSTSICVSKPGLSRETGSIVYGDSQKYFKEATTYTGKDIIRSPPSSQSPLGKHLRPVSSSSTKDNSASTCPLNSPIKKCFPSLPTKSAVSAQSVNQPKIVSQGVIEISSSPISSPRPVLVPDIHTAYFESKQTEKLIQQNIPKKVKAKRNKFVMLRDSLPGTWKEVDQEPTGERARGRTWRASQVEVLDMTDN